MSNITTPFNYGDYTQNLGKLFASGSSSFITGYKLLGNIELGSVFSDISGGTGLGYPIGYNIQNYAGITGYTRDLSELFLANNYTNFTVANTLTYVSNVIDGYTVLSITSGTGKINIDNSIQKPFYYCIVGGGGPGGCDHGGGGGGGGVIQGSFTINGSAEFDIAVGRGGIVTYGSTTEDGKNSILTYRYTGVNKTTLTAIGGGYGGWATGWGSPKNTGSDGGCGGGSGVNTTVVGIGSQGKNGGRANTGAQGGGGGGGGGMTTVGGNAVGDVCGNGGTGIICTQNGINSLYPTRYWGGGGGGGNGSSSTVGGNGGLGGGGGGSSPTPGTGGAGLNNGGNGTSLKGGNGGANTGGGGGGGSHLKVGGNGGSGMVIIAYLNPS
jgi:hypothetical protein